MNTTRRAKRGDRSALETMFRQFLPADEVIYDMQYLGQRGVLGFGTYSFAAVTDRRVSSLLVSMFGRVQYRDGYHEDINSSIVVQPSHVHETIAALVAVVLWIALLFEVVMARWRIGFLALAVAVWVAAGVTLSPTIARLLYRLSKSGLLLSVREGIAVYCFTDRSRLGLANRLSSLATMARERRVPLRPLGPTEDLLAPADPSASAVTERLRAGSWRLSPARHALVVGGAFTTLALLRSIAVPTWPPVTASRGPWMPTLPQLLGPSLVAYLAGALLVFAPGPRSRSVASGLVLGVGLGIGVQSTIGVSFVHLQRITSNAPGAPVVSVGYWIVQALGIALAAVALAGWVSSADEVRDLSNDADPNVPATGWMSIGGFAVLAGSLAPWVHGGDDRFWGLLSTLNAGERPSIVTAPFWLSATFMVGTTIAASVPLVAIALRRRWSSPGLLGGWLLTVAMMVGSVQLDGPRSFAIGFRLVEFGAVLGIIGAITALVAAPIRRSVSEHAARLAPWPPPAVARAD